MFIKSDMAYEIQNGSAKILRLYGRSDLVYVPEDIDGFPVTEIGPYIFSDAMDNEPGGQGVPLCGQQIREVYLPDSLKKIGRYAFYNCDGLRKLRISGATLDIGQGAFNGCRKITDLEITIIPGEKSCLKEILSELNEKVYVTYQVFGKDEGAYLIFPPFYEEAVENTPARILETHTHGCGHRYRYCFKGSDFQFQEYDSLFPFAIARESKEMTAELALLRLRFPYALSQTARKRYEAYVETWIEMAGEYFIFKNDLEGLQWFINKFGPQKDFEGQKVYNNSKKDIGKAIEHASGGLHEGLTERAREGLCNIRKSALGEAEFDKLLNAANRCNRLEILSCLMDQKRRLFPIRRKNFLL